jgi:hypothetical protein
MIILLAFMRFVLIFGGELGIRTPGPVTVNSFQDCRNRPLCQLSGAKVRLESFQPKTFKNLFAPDHGL